MSTYLWYLIIQYQLASAHTHCLIMFLKSIRFDERDAYSIDRSPFVNSRKWFIKHYFHHSALPLFLRNKIAVECAHSSAKTWVVNRINQLIWISLNLALGASILKSCFQTGDHYFFGTKRLNSLSVFGRLEIFLLSSAFK